MQENRIRVAQYVTAAQDNLGAAVATIVETQTDSELIPVGRKLIAIMHELQSVKDRLCENEQATAKSVQRVNEVQKRLA